MKLKILILFACLLLSLLLACNKETSVDLVFTEHNSHSIFDINAIVFTDSLHGHAVGGNRWESGAYTYTTDGGNSWRTDSLPTAELFDIDYTKNGYGATAGVSGFIRHQEPLQNTWNPVYEFLWSWLTGIDFYDKQKLLVCGGQAYQHGIIYRMDENYQILHKDTFLNEISAVCWSDEMTAHAVGYGIVMRSIDAGFSWQIADINGDFFRSVCFPDDKTGYAVGYSGTIIKTTDAGATWKKLRSIDALTAKRYPFRKVQFLDAQNGFIAGENGTLWRTSDGGDNWQIVKNTPDVDFYGLCLQQRKGWLAGKGGKLFSFSF